MNLVYVLMDQSKNMIADLRNQMVPFTEGMNSADVQCAAIPSLVDRRQHNQYVTKMHMSTHGKLYKNQPK